MARSGSNDASAIGWGKTDSDSREETLSIYDYAKVTYGQLDGSGQVINQTVVQGTSSAKIEEKQEVSKNNAYAKIEPGDCDVTYILPSSGQTWNFSAVPDGEKHYRIREINSKGQTVHIDTDLDSVQIKTALDKLKDWKKYWEVDWSWDGLSKLLGVDVKRPEPTVVYKVSDANGSHNTKYYPEFLPDPADVVWDDSAISSICC